MQVMSHSFCNSAGIPTAESSSFSGNFLQTMFHMSLRKFVVQQNLIIRTPFSNFAVYWANI